MKRFVSSVLILGILTLGAIGCAEKSTVTTKKTISTPEGTTTEKQTTEVKKTGENPP